MNTFFNPERSTWPQLLQRPTQTIGDIEETVNHVFEKVTQQGDRALREFTQKFDQVEIQHFAVSETEFNEANHQISADLKNAISLAKQNIESFHKAQKLGKCVVETSPGVLCWQEARPIEKVGLYIPGGTAPLFSTILMLAVPAVIAGCKEIVICSPPDKNGHIHPAILYTASVCGIKKIFKVGGIQAIAALTFGTESIPSVYKIFGPGNQFVTVAKQLATRHGVAIDMPAGPSELLVVADETANPAFVAADLLSQAEHGKDSQVLLVATCRILIDKVIGEVASQIDALPRKAIAEKAMENSRFIFVENKETAIDLINAYAPEHFIIQARHEDFYANHIINVGSVFIGPYTPESAGDYASGTNHTLPTNGFARQYSGVNLDSFTKKVTFQKISKKGIQQIGGAIEIMAETEGLQAHRNAVTLRINE
ncbi:MAG: histidinol dehydrogenase [Bacteroidetes bacterium]|nr:histidinol dehydrogenase [Bacteroidota bacterium]